MGFLEPVSWTRENTGLTADRVGKEIDCMGCLRGKGQGTDLESSQLYGHLVNLMPWIYLVS